MAYVSLNSIDEVTKEILKMMDVDKESISIILDTIHYANCRGIPTHGIGRLPLYVKKIRCGHFNPKSKIDIVSDFGATAVLNAHNGFGQVAAHQAMKLAIEKAKHFGIAAVGVRNSNNFGAAGYFGTMATEAGMAAIIFANAAPAIAPTGGNKPIFGTNPICYAFPGGIHRNPVILDMATTVAARGKIRLSAKNGEKIPFGWALDEEGSPTDDPNKALNGTLLPIGGYKGYGLSMFVDLFAGVLTGSASMGNVKPLSEMEMDSKNGHMFIVINVSHFMNINELSQKMNQFYDAVKACGEEGMILLPGERVDSQERKNIKAVTIPDRQWQEINELAKELGVAARLEIA